MPIPYMTDPTILSSLIGQQYVVLRPSDAVAAFYDREQSALLARRPGAMPHPNAGHVTLRGFSEPGRVSLLAEHVKSWSGTTPPIELEVEAVDGFPSPFQVVMARLARTDSLVEAYASLTAVLEPTDFTRVGELTLADWVFHLSLAYATALDERSWHEFLQTCQRDVTPVPRELVTSVDFVWYDDHGEHVDSFPLRAV